MPYVSLPPVPTATGMALAHARWASMLAARPDLHAAIELQRTLIGLVLELTGTFAAARPPRLSLPPRYLATKLGSGIPALAGEPIPMPSDMLSTTVVKLSQALVAGGGGAASSEMLDAIHGARLNIPAVLALALRRDHGALRAAATRAGVGHDLLWLVAELAVSPFAHAQLEAVFGAVPVDSPLAAALSAWSRGYCPLCGSWPALTEDLGGVRRLRCALCAAAWELTDRACLYCGEAGERFATVTPDATRPRRCVETCGACHGYNKVVEADTSMPFPLLALADLESIDLDIAAMANGCARPPSRQFAGRR